MTGQELKKARVRVNLTQKRLGEQLGYEGKSAEVVVQLWEYGKQPIPVRHYRALAKLLELTLDDIVP